jgi:hypothetical protein
VYEFETFEQAFKARFATLKRPNTLKYQAKKFFDVQLAKDDSVRLTFSLHKTVRCD